MDEDGGIKQMEDGKSPRHHHHRARVAPKLLPNQDEIILDKHVKGGHQIILGGGKTRCCSGTSVQLQLETC